MAASRRHRRLHYLFLRCNWHLFLVIHNASRFIRGGFLCARDGGSYDDTEVEWLQPKSECEGKIFACFYEAFVPFARKISLKSS